ncbi:ABC transporter permease [Maribacter litopenaei]|uniref:ABC transporter permease n=1 Tax=Maribacter litopenaei TaxID=2976127 RepID=A0ABY5Y717_9FLAO|nr:ABC transporter permease [Maribacter litopenaei]UWX54663.1 ABC transporter permease [Maribacter litopenaei]
MLKNYLKIAWRNLWKDKTFTSINMVGLTIAFGVAILLATASFYELSYEDFHENRENIYGVYIVQQTEKGSEAGVSQPTPFAEALKSEVPGIGKITRVLENDALVINGEKELMLKTNWVDQDYFSMFTFPLIEGNTDNALQDLNSVVLTRKAAEKLFGNTDVVGSDFNVLINGKVEPFTVGAVAEDIPTNTDMGFEIALRFENNPEYLDTKESWNAQYHSVYVELKDNVSAEQFEQNTHAFVNLHYEEVMENAKNSGASPNEEGLYREIKLLPLKDKHFTSFRKGYAEISRSVPYLIIGVAFLILFIAFVNYVNMSVAKSSQRLKEIGMRKTLGAEENIFSFNFGEKAF